MYASIVARVIVAWLHSAVQIKSRVVLSKTFSRAMNSDGYHPLLSCQDQIFFTGGSESLEVQSLASDC